MPQTKSAQTLLDRQATVVAGRLLTLKEAAARLAVSERAIWKWTACGRFGPELIRLGRSVRVRESELTEWISAGCPNRETWLAQRDAQAARP